MFKQLVAVTILAASLMAAGCSDTKMESTATGPSAPFSVLQPGRSPLASISPSPLAAEHNSRFACPQLQPLRVTANLTVRSDDDVTVFLREVRMQFTDSTGLAAPQVTLPAPMLTSQFGTALINARSSRTFPLGFGFGCDTGRTGTLTVHVRMRDGHARDYSTDVRVAVR